MKHRKARQEEEYPLLSKVPTPLAFEEELLGSHLFPMRDSLVPFPFPGIMQSHNCSDKT
jgi:hypothetical protein